MTILGELPIDLNPEYAGTEVIQRKVGTGHNYQVTGFDHRLRGVTTYLGIIDKGGGLAHWTKTTALNKVRDFLEGDRYFGNRTGVAIGYLIGRLMQVEQDNLPGEDVYTPYLNQLFMDAHTYTDNLWDPQVYIDDILAQSAIQDTTGRDEGTATHLLIEAALTGQAPKEPVSEDMEARVMSAVQAAISTIHRLDLRVVAVEPCIYHPRYGFAGSIDFLCRDAFNNLVILDWKRARSLYDEYAYQVAAYMNAIKSLCKTNSQDATGIRGVVVRLPRTDAPLDEEAEERWVDEEIGLAKFLRAMSLHELHNDKTKTPWLV